MLDPYVGKRLVPTRNAATSPHLDLRKLDSLTKLSPSPKNITNKQSSSINKTGNKIDGVEEDGKLLDNNYSLRERKSYKQLTTHSLSPKAPAYHQQNLLISDLNHYDSKYMKLCNTSKKCKQQLNKVCRSEQSSPNVIDGSEIKFTYKELKNRSTSCLGGNTFFDPWLKAAGSHNSSINSSIKSCKEDKLSSENTTNKNSKDPWVKRADGKFSSKAERHEFIRQCNSFSTSKFKVKHFTYLHNYSKSPCFLNEEEKSASIKYVKNQLQSAPTSPHFLTTTENSFYLSSSYLNNQFNIVEKTPTRSASFSPARIKDGHNPFNNYILPVNLPYSPPPSLSVGPEVVNVKKFNYTSANYESLNVFNPNFLNTRHSFSSVSVQDKTNELQLNIRRLSDQIRKTESIVINETKTHTNDRNVEEKKKDIRKQAVCYKNNTKVKNLPNRADFSEYLEQFRCSEAKKAAIVEKDGFKENNFMNTDSKNINMKVNNKPHLSTDCPLETTC